MILTLAVVGGQVKRPLVGYLVAAYAAGREVGARPDGRVRLNPYRKRSTLRAAWLRGFRDARP